jgi:hypothetical protein
LIRRPILARSLDAFSASLLKYVAYAGVQKCNPAILNGVEETAAMLLNVSEHAQDRKRLGDKGYALITAQNAAALIERGKQGRAR